MVSVMTERSIVHARLMKLLENAVGCRLFRDFLIMKKGEAVNATQDGLLSCAFFVSSILRLATLRDETPLIDTVSLSNIDLFDEDEGEKKNRQLRDCGWVEIDVPDWTWLEPGALVLWEKQGPARHSGFIFEQGDEPWAISNSSVNGMPIKHHPTFYDRRRIILAFWHPAFDI